MTEPELLQQVDRTYVRVGRRKLSYFSGCDYFRLASHPRVIAALKQGADAYGLNVAASRLTTGNHALYDELERRLADFFRVESAILVSSGYASNIVAAQAMAGDFSHALIDQESHPSLANAARFLDCAVSQFRHCDPGDLARLVRRCGPKARLVVLTDGMFSRDGSAAPLAEYLKVLPGNALILVDEAHSAGVLGKTGKGAVELTGVDRRRVVQTITLSKAFGAYGGAVLGTIALRRKIFQRSQLFVGSTPLPLPLANAALESLGLLKSAPTFRTRLERNRRYVKEALRAAGFALDDTPGPIVMYVPKRKGEAARVRKALLKAGIYPPFLRYPGGPTGGYFRFVISSEHTDSQLESIIRTLAGVAGMGTQGAE